MAQECLSSSRLCHAGASCGNGLVAQAQAAHLLLPKRDIPRWHPALKPWQPCLTPVTSALSYRLDATSSHGNMPCIPQLPPSDPCRLSTGLYAGQDGIVGGHMPTVPQLGHPQTCVTEDGQ